MPLVSFSWSIPAITSLKCLRKENAFEFLVLSADVGASWLTTFVNKTSTFFNRSSSSRTRTWPSPPTSCATSNPPRTLILTPTLYPTLISLSSLTSSKTGNTNFCSSYDIPLITITFYVDNKYLNPNVLTYQNDLCNASYNELITIKLSLVIPQITDNCLTAIFYSASRNQVFYVDIKYLNLNVLIYRNNLCNVPYNVLLTTKCSLTLPQITDNCPTAILYSASRNRAESPLKSDNVLFDNPIKSYSIDGLLCYLYLHRSPFVINLSRQDLIMTTSRRSKNARSNRYNTMLINKLWQIPHCYANHLTTALTDYRHHTLYSRLLIIVSMDVESNPGPEATPLPDIKVVTYNVRGLNDDRKLRHLLNYIYKMDMGKNSDLVVCLQETYIIDPGKIPYLWRGNYALTPGTGHSCGCVTLTSPSLNILANEALDNRGHVLALERNGESGCKYVLANIYAPNVNNALKVDFFEKAFETVLEFEEQFDCSTSLVTGDFNLNLSSQEVKNRLYTTQEKGVAEVVKELASTLNLQEIWHAQHEFTWRRANADVYSTIDRMFYSDNALNMLKCETNWSLSKSDHAAVIATFTFKSTTKKPRDRITRLDPSLAKHPVYGPRIVEEYNQMLGTAPGHWDPHTRLEFAKLCIRTVVEKIQAERKRQETNEEHLLNEELNIAIKTLGDGSYTGSHRNLIQHIEELRIEKDRLVEDRGERLAERLGTKWYNEGEKSTKYFLRLLNRTMPDEISILKNDNGAEIKDFDEIERLITRFYKDLYEEFQDITVEDDQTFFNGIEQISGHQQDTLMQQLTEQELRETLHGCRDSAPGPDGIPYSIIGLVWHSFGKILCDAWNYSLLKKELPPSHKISYLRLIPKVGKDLKNLANWRPISLSNCDHKLITKTYASRLCTAVASKISESQTAYIRGRSINENIRSMLATVNLANVEETANGILIALDARKAFDSVSHKYIARCLKEFGCEKFVEIFEVLYKDLRTDILINGKIVKGFKVNRGVKQGDALSCIIFIMCMEPLLRNIESNPDIKPIRSTTLRCTLPKGYGYADDINLTTKGDSETVQAVFHEYERLSKMSGLVLNAEKTEIMRINGNRDNETITYNVKYLEQRFRIRTTERAKINGIIFQDNQEQLVDQNVDAALRRIDKHFRAWSKRSLSTLGKILISKTFGISQCIYLMQSMMIKECHVKRINSLLYKFIWNRHYLAAKAPERINRKILCTPIKHGGFGMLDIADLDKVLKLKIFSRLLVTNHPFLKKIRDRIDMTQLFCIDLRTRIDEPLNYAVELMNGLYDDLWRAVDLGRSLDFMCAIRDSNIINVLDVRGRDSISFFLIRQRGKAKIGQLTIEEYRALEAHIAPHKRDKIRSAIALNIPPRQNSLIGYIYTGRKFASLSKCDSQTIRNKIAPKPLICEYKIGLNLEENRCRTWLLRISKLISVKHKNILLRTSHAEIYTMERLSRYGLVNTNSCPRCDMVEDLQHKLFKCIYAEKIWDYLLRLTGSEHSLDRLEAIMGVHANPDYLCLHAEIISRILQLPREPNYLIHPKFFVTLAIKYLVKRETKPSIRMSLEELL